MLDYLEDKTYQNWLVQLIDKKSSVQITPDMDLYQLCSQQSECIEYEFDYNGTLMGRIEWRGLGDWRMPSDYEEVAGVKFAVGQVVRLKSNPEKLYLVAVNAGRLCDSKNVFTRGNEYVLYSLEQSTQFPLPNIDDIFESNIEADAVREYSDLQKMQIQFLQQYLYGYCEEGYILRQDVCLFVVNMV